METFELKYFLKVAETENTHRASELLNVSPSTVSKAVSRLENELEVKLFEKSGRNIKITAKGRDLVRDAKEMIALEKRIKDCYSDEKESLSLRIIGPEIPLSQFAPAIIKKIQTSFNDLSVHLDVVTNEDAERMLKDYSADFAIIASQKKLYGKMHKLLTKVEFKTYVSQIHPLAKSRKPIPVEEILKEPFYITNSQITGLKTSDGWRDDKLKRINKNVVTSTKCLEVILKEGLGVAHLPESYAKSLGLKSIKIRGCPYVCTQYIYLTRNKYTLDRAWDLV